MKNYILSIIVTLLIFIPAYSYAQTDSKHSEDEKAIRQVVQNIADAWEAGDGVKFADNFTDDVEYTVWNGQFFSGREANIRGHQQIFNTIFKDTKLNSKIRKIRFLSDDIATVHMAEGQIIRNGKAVENHPPTSPLFIFIKEKGKWRATVFQNTPIIKLGELVVGRTQKGR